MPFDLNDLRFSLGEYDKEIKELLPKLSDVEFSALSATMAGFVIKNRGSFMNSKTAAWELMKMFRGVVTKEFPGEAHGDEKHRTEQSSGMPRVHQSEGSSANPSLPAPPEGRVVQGDFLQSIEGDQPDPPLPLDDGEPLTVVEDGTPDPVPAHPESGEAGCLESI